MRGVSGKRWRLISKEVEVPLELVKIYGPLLAQLLANRGLTHTAERFLKPSLRDMPPATSIPFLTESAQRIAQAVKRGERIVIYGDYDVDGISATAILYEILRSAGARAVAVLPSRKTGYGLNRDLTRLFSRYCDLLITVDNGTSAVEEIDTSPIDVIVIDHHNVPERIPTKALLVNPRAYGEAGREIKELSSSGISLYMGIYLAGLLDVEVELKKLLALSALGTLGDVVPMNPINRAIVAKGLEVLDTVPGLRALLKSSLKKKKITARDLVYSVIPRLNAPGRMADPKIALDLLTEKDEEKALLLAQKVERLNERRKTISRIIFNQALRRAKDQRDSFIVLWDRRWHPGVLGIVAGRIADTLGRPTAVFSMGRNLAVGSVRSADGVDVYKVLEPFSHHFLKWGGHPKAVGLTLESRLLKDFSRWVKDSREIPKEEPPELPIDMELPLRNFGKRVREEIRRLEPFGEGNPAPTFLSEELKIEKVRRDSYKAFVTTDRGRLLCWESYLLPHLKEGVRVRVVYSYDGREINLVDVEEKDGSG